MQTQNKGGDVLARGNSRCQFAPMGGAVSQEAWDKMFEPETDSPAAESPKTPVETATEEPTK